MESAYHQTITSNTSFQTCLTVDPKQLYPCWGRMYHFLSIIATLWRSGYISAVYPGCQDFSNMFCGFAQSVQISSTTGARSLQIMNYAGRIECCSVAVSFGFGSNLCRDTYTDWGSRDFPQPIQTFGGACPKICQNFLLLPCQLLFYNHHKHSH